MRQAAVVWGVAAVAFTAFAATVLVRARTLWVFTVDDTFITLRYARHLAEGLGPAWNPGGPRVEGCTTALWMLWLAIPHWLGANGLTWAKGSSVACALASGALSGLVSLRLARGLSVCARGVAVGAPLVLCAAYWSLALHAVSGMETTLFALLLTLFFGMAVLFAEQGTSGQARGLAVLALLATLARPEGALVCGSTALVLAVRAQRPARIALMRAFALCTVLPGAAYFVWRMSYYGLLFPLPFYVKAQGHAGLAGAEDVAAFFAPFAVQQPYLLLLALAGLWRFRGALVAPAVGGGALALFFLVPSHIMGFEGRYLFPVFPLLALLVGAGAAACTEALVTRLAARSMPVGLALVPAAALCIALGLRPLPSWQAYETRRWVNYGEGLARAHQVLAGDLARLATAAVRPTIALLDVGAVSYYGEWFTIDLFGLNDVRMALSRSRDVGYVFAQDPELVVLVSAAPGRYVEVFDFEAPYHAEAVKRGFAYACDYEFLPDYHLHVLARPGSRVGPQLSCMQRKVARE